MADLDTALLRTFVSGVESGGFTRAGDRVHRTQSTVSQQVKKLEEQIGRQLLLRGVRGIELTEDGERLLAYARRILALNDEARQLFAEDVPELVRIGVPEDYAIEELPLLLGRFARRHPSARLEVRCGLSVQMEAELTAGELDIAVFKRLGSMPAAAGVWRDALNWVAAAEASPEHLPVLPLVVFNQGCIYRAHAIHVLESQRRAWRVAYTSPNLAGVLAAVRAGLGVAVLSDSALAPGLRRLGAADGLPPLPDSQLVLQARSRLGPAAEAALELLRDSLDARQRAVSGRVGAPLAPA